MDVWRDHARRIEREGWTQAEMAEWLGVKRQTVGLRIRLNEFEVLKKPVQDGLLNEGHCEAMCGVCKTSCKIDPWPTTAQVQGELIADPSYGMQFPSNRRVASGKKPRIANDEKQHALDLLRDLLNEAYPRMADRAAQNPVENSTAELSPRLFD